MGALKITGQSAAPTVTGSDAGMIYYDSDVNRLVIYNGTSWKWVSVEAVTRNVLFKIWAAGGGGSSGSCGAAGSPGGYVAGTLALTEEATIYVTVGQGGPILTDGRGSGGGGYSGIFTTSVAHGNALLIAGAGAGSGRGSAANGGGGGGLIGSAGWVHAGTQGADAGKGGTQSAGGAASSGAVAGSALTGGDSKNDGNQTAAAFGGGGKGGGDNSAYTAGGGGGGYYGGSGAGGTGGGGGGGGSSYVGSATSTTNTQGVRVSGQTATNAPNNSDSEYVAGVGMGGTGGASNTVGGNGLVAYSYNGSSWTTLSYTGGTQTFTVAAA